MRLLNRTFTNLTLQDMLQVVWGAVSDENAFGDTCRGILQCMESDYSWIAKLADESSHAKMLGAEDGQCGYVLNGLDCRDFDRFTAFLNGFSAPAAGLSYACTQNGQLYLDDGNGYSWLLQRPDGSDHAAAMRNVSMGGYRLTGVEHYGAFHGQNLAMLWQWKPDTRRHQNSSLTAIAVLAPGAVVPADSLFQPARQKLAV